MSREILFRGKDLETGKWLYGSFIKTPNHAHISTSGEAFPAKVEPETISQYTGLTDKNGVKIFEGDIVRHYCKLPVLGGEIGTDRGIIKWNSEECFFFRTSLDGKDKTISAKCEYEIIGNIYDNPELITVVEKSENERNENA